MTEVLMARHRFAGGSVLAAVSAAFDAADGDVILAAQSVCRLVADAFGDTAMLRLGESLEDLRLVAVATPEAEVADDVARTFDSGQLPLAVREVFLRGHGLVVRPGDALLENGPLLQSFADRVGYQLSLLAPLRARGRVTGTFSVICTHPEHRHGEDDIELLCEVADRCGLDVDNARMLGRLTHELGERSLAERRHATLLRHTSDVILVVSGTGKVLDVTPAIRTVLGWKPEDVVRTSIFELVALPDRALVAQQLGDAADRRAPVGATEFRVRHADGSTRWMEATGNNLLDDPAVGALVITARDVTERRIAAELLAAENKVLQQIAAVAPLQDILDDLCRLVESRIPGCIASVWVLDGPDRLVKRASPSVDLGPIVGDRELVLSAERVGLLRPHHPPVLVAEVGSSRQWDGWTDVARAVGVTGSWSRAVCEPGGAPLGSIVTFFVDLPQPTPEQVQVLELATHLAGMALERDRWSREVAYAATHDALTGLPNRARFLDQLGRVLRRSGPEGEVAVLFIDLDDFKVVNDSSGHGVGDELLREAAARLTEVIRPMDLIARFGGDEFAVLCDGLDADGASRVAQRVLEVLDTPFPLDGRSFHVSASVGIAVGNGDTTPDSVLRDADTAMYQAKRDGRNRCSLFTPAVREATVRRLVLEQAVRRAIERSELAVHYQPVVDLATGALVGLEALARWTSDEHGEVPPFEFIETAERAGLIGALGKYVLGKAAGQAAAWRAAGLLGDDVTMAVNVAAQQLTDPGFVPMVLEALEVAGLPCTALCLELTESAVMADVDAAQASLGRLRAAGITLAIDDFGTGHSSLARLRSLEASVLKLDRSFILDLDVDEGCVEMVQSVIQLAHALGKRLVVEGVELPSQLRILRGLGADAVQGFLLARPQPPAAMEGLLRVTPTWDEPR